MSKDTKKSIDAIRRALKAAEAFDAADAAFVVDSLVQGFGLTDTANYTIARKVRP